MRLRLFLTAWAVFALFFATNVVREHYPALALVEHGDFVLDDYAGLHADIFEHTDGHHYINNQVTTSVLAAPVLLLFRPLLDTLHERGVAAARARGDEPAQTRDTEYPGRARFFAEASRRGLLLMLGATTVLTSVLFMAPLSALLVLLLFDALVFRGVPRRRAVIYALIGGFATPVLYRTAFLNHNQLMALATFASFLALFRRAGDGARPRDYAASGFFAGWTLALDYSGVVALLALFGYALKRAWDDGGPAGAARRGALFVAGSVPPVLLLWGTQWAQYGNPFLPAQSWMAVPNELASAGYRGFGLPHGDLVIENLLAPNWGLFMFGPLLLLALWPARGSDTALVMPRRERGFVLIFGAVFLLFCSANQFARLQWNTGFRYLAPLVPLLFLMTVDTLRRFPPKLSWTLCGLAALHSFVLSSTRYTPHEGDSTNAMIGSWKRALENGFTLPWHDVLMSQNSVRVPVVGSPWFPYVLVAVLLCALYLLWRGVRFDVAERSA